MRIECEIKEETDLEDAEPAHGHMTADQTAALEKMFIFSFEYCFLENSVISRKATIAGFSVDWLSFLLILNIVKSYMCIYPFYNI